MVVYRLVDPVYEWLNGLADSVGNLANTLLCWLGEDLPDNQASSIENLHDDPNAWRYHNAPPLMRASCDLERVDSESTAGRPDPIEGDCFLR